MTFFRIKAVRNTRAIIYRQKGFTLVEMLIVVCIVSISVPVIVTLFSAVMRQQTQTMIVTQTRNQATAALQNIKTLIRNHAYTIHSDYPATDANAICTSQTDIQTPSRMVFRDEYEKSFYFELDSGVLASASSQLAAPVPLNFAPVTITHFEITCSRPSLYAAPIVNISFLVSHANNNFGTTTLPFQTRLRLRNK